MLNALGHDEPSSYVAPFGLVRRVRSRGVCRLISSGLFQNLCLFYDGDALFHISWV